MQGEATHEEPLEGYAKYRHLKANVGRRRAAYIWIFLLALIVLGAAAAHIALVMESPMSDTDNMIMYAVYGALGILFLWALLLLFSGKRPVEEEAYVPREMERTLLQCPECKSTFQFGEQNFSNNQRTAFKVLRPEGDYKELRYHCTNCNEDLAVGTFGATPLHLVRFRACPHCGEKGHIERIQGVVGTPPAPEEEWS
jgi:DNA-directed RNA polymerase subunit RPC12/RpoP